MANDGPDQTSEGPQQFKAFLKHPQSSRYLIGDHAFTRQWLVEVGDTANLQEVELLVGHETKILRDEWCWVFTELPNGNYTITQENSFMAITIMVPEADLGLETQGPITAGKPEEGLKMRSHTALGAAPGDCDRVGLWPLCQPEPLPNQQWRFDRAAKTIMGPLDRFLTLDRSYQARWHVIGEGKSPSSSQMWDMEMKNAGTQGPLPPPARLRVGPFSVGDFRECPVMDTFLGTLYGGALGACISLATVGMPPSAIHTTYNTRNLPFPIYWKTVHNCMYQFGDWHRDFDMVVGPASDSLISCEGQELHKRGFSMDELELSTDRLATKDLPCWGIRPNNYHGMILPLSGDSSAPIMIDKADFAQPRPPFPEGPPCITIDEPTSLYAQSYLRCLLIGAFWTFDSSHCRSTCGLLVKQTEREHRLRHRRSLSETPTPTGSRPPRIVTDFTSPPQSPPQSPPPSRPGSAAKSRPRSAERSRPGSAGRSPGGRQGRSAAGRSPLRKGGRGRSRPGSPAVAGTGVRAAMMQRAKAMGKGKSDASEASLVLFTSDITDKGEQARDCGKLSAAVFGVLLGHLVRNPIQAGTDLQAEFFDHEVEACAMWCEAPDMSPIVQTSITEIFRMVERQHEKPPEQTTVPLPGLSPNGRSTSQPVSPDTGSSSGAEASDATPPLSRTGKLVCVSAYSEWWDLTREAHSHLGEPLEPLFFAIWTVATAQQRVRIHNWQRIPLGFFEELLNTVARVGGPRSGLNCSIAGAVVGAVAGYSGLPREWLASMQRKYLLDRQCLGLLLTMSRFFGPQIRRKILPNQSSWEKYLAMDDATRAAGGTECGDLPPLTSGSLGEMPPPSLPHAPTHLSYRGF